MEIPLEESHKQLFHARIIFQLLTVSPVQKFGSVGSLYSYDSILVVTTG